MAIRKLISDPDTLALIFETLAGCRTAKNNTTSYAVANRLLPAAEGNGVHEQATKKTRKKGKKEVVNCQKRSPGFLPEGLEKMTGKGKQKQWLSHLFKAI